MKKNKISLSLLLVFFLVTSLSSSVFANEDLSSSNEDREEIQFDFGDSKEAPWADEYIGKMQSKDVIKGYEDGTFRPNAPVKRIEAIVMAVRLMGLEEEALEKSLDTKLHFKDANQIPNWGKGHIIVALENGLFNATEDKIQANKPASRIWIVNLLVKALELEPEALGLMTEIPDFKDANQIPAGSIGYVNVAIENGLINGYQDNTFKANKSVTRGEMAALLDRTNDGLLEQSGAVIVQGEITEISFAEEPVVEENMISALATTSGSISVQSFNGEEFTYSISPEMLVQYHNRFIRADQLRVGDIVTLVVNEEAVVEANLVDEDNVNTQSNIVELEIKLEQAEKELKIEYKNKKGKIEAEIETETNDEKVKIKGEEAIKQVEEIIEQLALTPDLSNEEILEKIVTALEIEGDKFKELEIEIKFSNGKKVDIEIEDDEDDDDDDEEDDEDEDE